MVNKQTQKKRGRKTHKAVGPLEAWRKFVKKVQVEEGIPYNKAMMRAKVRKDSGEKWRGGSDPISAELDPISAELLAKLEPDNTDKLTNDEITLLIAHLTQPETDNPKKKKIKDRVVNEYIKYCEELLTKNKKNAKASEALTEMIESLRKDLVIKEDVINAGTIFYISSADFQSDMATLLEIENVVGLNDGDEGTSEGDAIAPDEKAITPAEKAITSEDHVVPADNVAGKEDITSEDNEKAITTNTKGDDIAGQDGTVPGAVNTNTNTVPVNTNTVPVPSAKAEPGGGGRKKKRTQKKTKKQSRKKNKRLHYTDRKEK